MIIFNLLRSSAAFELKRYLRSPALLFVALAAPIAAHYMVPDKDAAYAVLTVNGAKPVLTAPVLGLELGVLAATLLTPLAYIFLQAGPTRHQPWQVTDVSPHSRAISTLGRWASDTCVLWILLAALTIAGLILGFFRLEGSADIPQTIVALWLPAAPSLALIAAVRLFLGARNFTRGWVGDVVFFLVWMALLLSGILGSIESETGAMTANSMIDAFGFTSPIIGSVDYAVTAVSIGGATNPGESVVIDAWLGVTRPDYIGARFVWVALSAALALVAGLIWSPMKTRQSTSKGRNVSAAEALEFSIPNVPFKAPIALRAGSTNCLSVVHGEVKLMFRNKAWLLIFTVAAISGAFLPFRTVAGPAILLALIFPLTEASARWQSKTLEKLLDTLGPGRIRRAGALMCASILVAGIVMLPAVLRMIIESEFLWFPHAMFVTLAVPVIIVLTGNITRSAVTGRLLMLIAWYVYLSAASV